MTETNLKIFISYRQQDNPDFVERIRDWFIQNYGRERVFMDFDTIPPFVKFNDFIKARIQECDVLIAIIGPRWIELLKEKGSSSEEDYVVTEISLALKLRKMVAPLCIKGASVPRPSDLPKKLRPMLEYNFASLNSGRDFLENIVRVVSAVEQEAKKHNIKLAEGYFESANTKFTNGEYAGTISECNEAIRLNPDNPYYYLLRSYALMATGDLHDASNDLDIAFGFGTEDDIFYAASADLYVLLEDHEDALADYARAIELDPHNPEYYVKRGKVHKDDGNLDGAIEDFTAAISLDSQNYDAFFYRSKCHSEKGNFQQAMFDSMQALMLIGAKRQTRSQE